MGRFYDELIDSPIFNSIFSEIKMINFRPTIMRDLFIINDFYQSKKVLNERGELDKKNNALLDKFYRAALIIRLSEQDKLTQAQNLLVTAYQFFDDKQSKELLWQEILALLGSLFDGEGLVLKINQKRRESICFFKPEFFTHHAKLPSLPSNWLIKD